MCHESSRLRARRDHRHRQGLGQPRRHPPGQADRGRRAEPGHQPPPDALRAGGGQGATAPASSRSTRCRRPGLVRFKNPQTPGASSVRHRARRPAPADPAQRRPGALPGHRRRCWSSGTPSTTSSSATYTAGFDDVRRPRRATSTGTRSRRPPASTRAQIEEAAEMFRDSDGHRSPAGRWASPSTATRSRTIKEIVNVALLQGNIGKPGAGVCPVRGHSNVQGDRTMGIWERVPEHFLDALARRVRLRPAARARLRRRRRDPGPARREGPGLLRDGRQLRRRRAPTPRSPRRRCATPR